MLFSTVQALTAHVAHSSHTSKLYMQHTCRNAAALCNARNAHMQSVRAPHCVSLVSTTTTVNQPGMPSMLVVDIYNAPNE
jgi:hypothetical protein